MVNKNIAITSVLIALVALLILIFSLAFVIMSQSATRAKVENVIEPLDIYNYQDDTPTIHIYDSDDDDDDVDEDPVIYGLPDLTLNFAQFVTLDLDNYASDDEDSHSDLTFTILYTPTISPDPLTLSIDSATHVLTITESNGVWTGSQAVTIRVEDTDGNTDDDSFTVTITDGSTPVNAPVISGLPDVEFEEDTSDSSIDLDDYVTDPDHSDAELTWTYTGNTNVIVSIGSDHVVTFTATSDWNGNEDITFRVEDPDGNFDEETINVEVEEENDPTIWLPLSDQTIDEDSPAGTVVYVNVASRVSDADGPVTINVASSNTHFTVNMVGNDLILSNIDANWYGFETVTLEANGQTATFRLNINQLIDDCIEICSYSTCYTYCD